MLSAAIAEPQIGHEAAVRTFAELAAGLANLGFFTADRSGVVTAISPAAAWRSAAMDAEVVGDPLASLVHPDDKAAFAAVPRAPCPLRGDRAAGDRAQGRGPGSSCLVFAEGQAGIVTGYFGFVRTRPVAPAPRRARRTSSSPRCWRGSAAACGGRSIPSSALPT
jgi:hypothetical protein